MKIFSPTISRLARLRHWRIEEWMAHPIDIQREVLQDLVTHGQNTSFGRQYGFNQIFNTRQFKAAVPIHEYPDIKPCIDRIMQGEENVLWNTPVNWFAKSSGTTSDKSKFIPITAESLENCHYQAAKDVLTLHYHNRPESDLLTGKGLVIGGSHQVSQLNEEIFYGDLSAVLLQNTPFWGQWLRTPELSIALMDEWEAKLEALAASTIKEDVTSISGVPTWTLILLKRILEITGKSKIKEVWPNLELYMHGGVSFTPYRQQFQQLLGDTVSYLEMYNASEGFFAVQDLPDSDGMLLLLNHGIFYEFMPIEEYGKPEPRTIGLKDVELHKNYAPVISTNGGLWRYLLGDTLQFTSLYPFRVKVSGRIRHFINAFGEELIVDNADQAIDYACRRLDCQVTEYTAAPIYFSEASNGAHEWLIEFEKAPEDMDTFTTVLDQRLQQLNSDYEAKRHKGIALSEPVIRVLPPRSFNKWLKSKNKLGGQHKVPRLSNDRKYIDEITALLAVDKTPA
ncbi:GH3 auxin-responsive promoter family protein [Arachidicoccus terrestris]|uniref:GH3 auxin-responsive promoter family protein n=1 Tax=Arachidicoccus terrestris TaxID=2875539 RepID=UPI001CC35FF2|nr:GH3 auxin-responsive promoter family protein [Arachidicoccus terrestris]UAY56756.1 GH3 auxin-responsive promoter family protein [Arachidicoccus terrestris]